jgi:uncharacterized protein (TIGR02391 family)
MASTVLPEFTAGQLERLARVLGESTTGSELDVMLSAARLPSSDTSTKWRRLRESFTIAQARDGNGNGVARFIKIALEPARFVELPEDHEKYRGEVNATIGFAGLRLEQNGNLVAISATKTIGEAEQRADHLRSKLQARDVHSDVLKYCRAELVRDNYFHAVLEASKSVAEKIRQLTGLAGDGVELADAAFTTKNNMPPLAFNRLVTPSELSEHRGLATMVKGFFMTFRNPTAHAPKVSWIVDESAALDMLATASMLHRRLDDATVTQAAPAFLLNQT